MKDELPIRQRMTRGVRRVLKIAKRRAVATALSERTPPHVVFVLGSGRSGTRVPLVALERSPDIITYSEGHKGIFRGALLTSDQVVHDLLRATPFPTVVLKPICESHRALEFLEGFPNARVIWIFRDYRDAVNSAAKKWTSAIRHVRNLATGQLQAAGWRAGGMTEEKLALVRELYTPDMTLPTANGIMWVLRNSLFFDLGLDKRSDVLLVRYEDLVRDPLVYFPRVFAFAQSSFEPRFVARIYDRSIGRDAPPVLPDRVRQLCEQIQARQMDVYNSQAPERIIPSATVDMTAGASDAL